MAENPHDDIVEAHDRGLAFDLPNLVNRRRALTLLAGAGLATVVGCASGSDDAATSGGSSTTAAPSTTAGATATSAGTSATTSGDEGSCTVIPEETAGPFPGDGSNGPDVLAESGVVRSDIRSSFGSASGVAEGVLLTVRMKVLELANGCAPLVGAAVYIWHCDAEGRYSMYSDGATDENYLRGVQETDGDGVLAFTSIFPGAYPGRWPHIHFEIYPSVADATSASAKLATSQLAFPVEHCELVYAADGYPGSAGHLASMSLETDMVFSDGYSQQLATTTGSVDEGFTAELTVAV